MAPPKTRRPGFSRRAQYGLFLGYVVAVAGILFSLLLLVVAVIDPPGFRALRSAALDASTPVAAGGRSVVRSVTGVGGTISDYFRAGSKNAELSRKLKAAETQIHEAQAIRLENERLKRLLSIRRGMADHVATARIVTSTFDSSRRIATISAGSNDGVAVGQPVRAAEGLIGRVVEAGWTASRVLMLTDGASNVPVRLIRDGTPAIAAGRGDGTVEIRPLEIGTNTFKRGDIFATSGTGGIFPPNIPVAVVLRATKDETIARPIADPGRADFAIVQGIYQPAAEQETLPAAPGQTQPAQPPASPR
jgi:rod shape-determining protein MreC